VSLESAGGSNMPEAPIPAPRIGIAAFDFDGTIVPGDSLRGFLVQLLGRRQFTAVLLRSLPAMGLGYWQAGRDQAKAALLIRTVAGLDEIAIERCGQEFAHTLASRVRPDIAQRLAWHRAQQHRLVLVSASLTVYLDPFGRELGFDHVIATRLEVNPDGHMSGRLSGANVRGMEKATRLKSLLGDDPFELWAYGDSAGDREMLAMADHAILVGSKPVPSL
jgi:phosphatidylglycerophosphatase C